MEMGILAVATITRSRLRGCVLKSDKERAKSGRGSHDIKYDASTGLAVVKWCDNKAVMLCSTFANMNPVDKSRRWSKEKKTYVEVDRPNIVRVYNCHMGGVDLSDMIMSLYHISIRSKR